MRVKLLRIIIIISVLLALAVIAVIALAYFMEYFRGQAGSGGGGGGVINTTPVGTGSYGGPVSATTTSATAVSWLTNPDNRANDTFTYTQNKSSGDYWTIKVSGIWALSYLSTENVKSGFNFAFLTRDANSAITATSSQLTYANSLGTFTTTNIFEKMITYVGPLNAGNIIRTHSQGGRQWSSSPPSFFKLSLLQKT